MMFETIHLKHIRLREQKKLSEGNLEIFKDITSYIQRSPLERCAAEDILQMIIDMMLQMQENNRSVIEAIGDHEQFCQSIVNEYIRSRSKIYNLMFYIQKELTMLFTFLITLLAINFMAGKTPTDGINTNNMIAFAILTCFFLPFPSLKQIKPKIILIAIFTSLLILWFISFNNLDVKFQPLINSYIYQVIAVMIITVVFIEIYKTVYRNIHKLKLI